MDDEDVLYLENIEEFINDEDRIVTYKWLSRTLSVPSNRAKQMLYTYLSKQKQDKTGNYISATYLVGGRSSVDGQMTQHFVLTNDENLDDTKSCFDVVTSVHIYSLQKSKPKDTNTLYAVDYDITQQHKDDTNRWNHIYCKYAMPFEDGGASRAKGKAKPGKENHEPASTAKHIVNGQGTSNHMTNSQKLKASNPKSKKGQLPNMGIFAAKNEKPSVEKEHVVEKPGEEKKPKTTEEKKSTKPSKSSGSMLSFFGKQIPAQQKSTDQKEEKPKSKTPEKEEKKTENKQKDNKGKIKEKSPEKVKETKKIKDETDEGSKSMDKGKDKAMSDKKSTETKKTSKQSRKRIKNLDSSDEEEEPIPKKFNKFASDSESNSEDDSKSKKSKGKKKKEAEDEETKSKKKRNNKKEKQSHQDEQEEKPAKTNRKRKKDTKSVSSEGESPIRPKSSNKTVVSETPVANQHSTGNPTKRRKRRKVMRSKTYVDDDGFMVTEKVYESESTDASDEEPIPVKQEQPQQAKKASPESKPKKVTELKPVKQASLMSFFKKS